MAVKQTIKNSKANKGAGKVSARNPGTDGQEEKIAKVAQGSVEGEAISEEAREELEDRQEEVAAASSGGQSAEALAAAAAAPAEMSASFKNFRHHPDMENFYRFIYENDLRHEALGIIDDIIVEKRKRKQLKAVKSHAH